MYIYISDTPKPASCGSSARTSSRTCRHQLVLDIRNPEPYLDLPV